MGRSLLDFLIAGAICKEETTSCGSQFSHIKSMLFVKIWFLQWDSPLLLHPSLGFTAYYYQPTHDFNFVTNFSSMVGVQALEILTGCYILVHVILTFISLFKMWRQYIYLHYDMSLLALWYEFTCTMIWVRSWFLSISHAISQGNTVAAMGSFKGLKQIRRIVEECMLNKMHPVYNIKVNWYVFYQADFCVI